MDRNVKHILNGYTSKEAVNGDVLLNIQVNSNERLLPPDELNRVVDIGRQFNKERQNSSFYRISGKINPLVTNVLFNTTGVKDCWEIFSTPIFTANKLDDDNPTLSYAESIKKHLKEIDGWWGYSDPILNNIGLCKYYDMEPTRNRFSFVPDITNVPNKLVKNWELTITYPYTSDTTNYLIKNGILIVDKKAVFVGGKEMTAFAVPIQHNLLSGSIVRISGTDFDGDYEVKRVGLDNGDYKEYYFCIDILEDTINIDIESRMSKVYKDFVCEYYIRKFKKVKTRSTTVIQDDDYEIYKLAFSENVFTDDITQFVINEDIDVNGLTDNLKRPLSELYVTIIKTSSEGIFTPVMSGIEMPVIPELNNHVSLPYLANLPLIQKIHGVSGITSYTPFESNVDVTMDDFFGDVVEYNKAILIETTLADINYRFNTVNRESTTNLIVSGPRPEGYYYSPHTQIKIRDFSSYIEQGTVTTAGMPEYRVDLGDGRYIWRDLLDIGVTDLKTNKLNYPFVNGCHYLFDNYCFDVKRQDPFDNWDMYHSVFPADPIGNAMPNRFKVNSAENVC